MNRLSAFLLHFLILLETSLTLLLQKWKAIVILSMSKVNVQAHAYNYAYTVPISLNRRKRSLHRGEYPSLAADLLLRARPLLAPAVLLHVLQLPDEVGYGCQLRRHLHPGLVPRLYLRKRIVEDLQQLILDQAAAERHLKKRRCEVKGQRTRPQRS